jgi:hypothetical protein
LVQEFEEIGDDKVARALGFQHAPFWKLERDFILTTVVEGHKLRADLKVPSMKSKGETSIWIQNYRESWRRDRAI